MLRAVGLASPEPPVAQPPTAPARSAVREGLGRRPRSRLPRLARRDVAAPPAPRPPVDGRPRPLARPRGRRVALLEGVAVGPEQAARVHVADARRVRPDTEARCADPQAAAGHGGPEEGRRPVADTQPQVRVVVASPGDAARPRGRLRRVERRGVADATRPVDPRQAPRPRRAAARVDSAPRVRRAARGDAPQDPEGPRGRGRDADPRRRPVDGRGRRPVGGQNAGPQSLRGVGAPRPDALGLGPADPGASRGRVEDERPPLAPPQAADDRRRRAEVGRRPGAGGAVAGNAETRPRRRDGDRAVLKPDDVGEVDADRRAVEGAPRRV